MSWRIKPCFIENCPKDIDVIMYVDESGDANMKHINEKYELGTIDTERNIHFALTGVIMDSSNTPLTRDLMMGLKNKYWTNGLCDYKGTTKRVVLHSRDIRGNNYPFSDKMIDTDMFLNDLTNVITQIPFTVIGIGINKMKLYERYGDRYNAYDISVEFILERFAKYLKPEQKGIVIFESREKKPNRKVHNHAINKLTHGTHYVSKDIMSRISGLYFNAKWCRNNEKESFFGLELADLVCYPIYNYLRNGVKDRAFLSFENKFRGYPNYIGRGYKQFP